MMQASFRTIVPSHFDLGGAIPARFCLSSPLWWDGVCDTEGG